jgi:hypothetical protein
LKTKWGTPAGAELVDPRRAVRRRADHAVARHELVEQLSVDPGEFGSGIADRSLTVLADGDVDVPRVLDSRRFATGLSTQRMESFAAGSIA